MKPFDLKTWQENPGISLRTERGKIVLNLNYIPSLGEFCMIGLLVGDHYPQSWTTKGKFHLILKGDDLLFADDPQPKLRPWKPEEVPMPVCWIRDTGNRKGMLITVINSLSVESDFGEICYPHLLSDYEHTTDGKTWLPCGVLE